MSIDSLVGVGGNVGEATGSRNSGVDVATIGVSIVAVLPGGSTGVTIEVVGAAIPPEPTPPGESTSAREHARLTARNVNQRNINARNPEDCWKDNRIILKSGLDRFDRHMPRAVLSHARAAHHTVHPNPQRSNHQD